MPTRANAVKVGITTQRIRFVTIALVAVSLVKHQPRGKHRSVLIGTSSAERRVNR